jgi:HD-GYP domain-containing protein (c-di-GMP phosphodiesterase class II)
MRTGNSKHDMAKMMQHVSNIVSTSLNLDKVTDVILTESKKALGTDHASLFLLGEDSKHLILSKAKGFTKDEINNIKLLGSWEVINKSLLRRKKPLVVNDVNQNALFKNKVLPFFHEKLPIHSFLAVPLLKDKKTVGALIVSNRKRPGHAFDRDNIRMLVSLSNYIAISLLNARLYHNLKDFFISTVSSLIRAVDAKDPYTSGHSERVMKYAVAIGEQYGLKDKALENLRLASLLHDIGKIGIKDNILSKPSRLSRDEQTQMKTHPSIGARIIEIVDDSHQITRGVLEHHERYDGSGYPRGLKKGAISLEARIIAVADTFDALTTNRIYRKKHSARDVFAGIVKSSSIHFDPNVVKAFINSYYQHPAIWAV